MVDTKRLTALVDADILVYACGFAADAQAKNDLAETAAIDRVLGLAPALEDFDYERWALANVKTVIQDIQQLFNPDVKLYLTGSGNFREQLATIQQYKGNRDPTHRPKYYREIKNYLIQAWNSEVVHGREADDVLGCTQCAAEPDTTVIVSIDKDLDNIPGYHYNWRRKEFYHIDQERADYLFWTQVLTGDKTDNIQGIPGIGPKKAEKILDATDGSWFSMADAVERAYEAAGLGWSEMYENASLLWIQREDNINWDGNPYNIEEESNDD